MTDPTPPAAGEPEDAAPVLTSEYWIGYYNGKAAAMRNIGTVRRTELVSTRGLERMLKWINVLWWMALATFAGSFTWSVVDHAVSGWSWWSLGAWCVLIPQHLIDRYRQKR